MATSTRYTCAKPGARTGWICRTIWTARPAPRPPSRASTGWNKRCASVTTTCNSWYPSRLPRHCRPNCGMPAGWRGSGRSRPEAGAADFLHFHGGSRTSQGNADVAIVLQVSGRFDNLVHMGGVAGDFPDTPQRLESGRQSTPLSLSRPTVKNSHARLVPRSHVDQSIRGLRCFGNLSTSSGSSSPRRR